MKRFLITFSILLLLLAVLSAVIFYFVGSRLQEEDENFTVLYNGVTLGELDQSLSTSPAEPLLFTIRGNQDYTVRVIPAEGVDLTYTLFGQIVQTASILSLSDCDDLTDCFDLVRTESTLTLFPKGDLQRMLTIHHTDGTVGLSKDADLNQDLFTLIISSGDIVYRVNFGIYIYDVNRVKVEPERLVF